MSHAVSTRPWVTRAEYRLAFDLMYARIAGERRASQPLLVAASASTLLHEALLRVERASQVMVAPALADTARALACSSRAADEVSVYTVGRTDSRSAPSGCGAALWVAPQPRDWRCWLDAIDARLLPRAPLAILVAGPLTWLFGALRTSLETGEPRWPLPALRPALAARGYRCTAACHVGGVTPLARAVLARLSVSIGREDLGDRWPVGAAIDIDRARHSRMCSYTVLFARKRSGR